MTTEPTQPPATGAIERALSYEVAARRAGYCCYWCDQFATTRSGIVHTPDDRGERCPVPAALAEARELRAEVARLTEERDEAVTLLRSDTEPIRRSISLTGFTECYKCRRYDGEGESVIHELDCPWHKRTVFLAALDGKEGVGDGKV